MIPAVHFQFMPDSGEIAEKLFSSEKPFLASIVPNLLDKNMKTETGQDIHNRIHPDNNYYPEWAIELFRQNKDNPNIVWVQEGYRHCCERCHEKFEKNGGRGKGWPDPFHEHICLDGQSQSLEKQIKVIEKGKKLMEEQLGIAPTGYCPPNHLHNDDTLIATKRNNFDYFLTRNGLGYFYSDITNFPAYRDQGLIIVPESKIGKTKTPIALTYYDHLQQRQGEQNKWEEFSRILESSTPISKLPVGEKPMVKTYINQKLITTYKKIRDWERQIRAFGE